MSTAPFVLAIEDDARNAALMRATLARGGYRLAIAGTLSEARAWLETTRPDVVLLDISLPDGDGLDLARELRARATTEDLPIIVTSARVLPADRERADAAGCDAFMPKPLRPSELLQALAERIGPGSAADSGQGTQGA